jgi:hypothetical protein
MKRWPINHLTAEDLDAFHSASLSNEALQHLDECTDCRTMLQQDAALLVALAQLPALEPSSGFTDRVMARVEVKRAPARVFSPRIALAATVVVALGASIIWSLLNREQLLAWLNQSASAVGSSLWTGVRVLVSNLNEQSWFASLRHFASSSGRVVLAAGGLLLGYSAALMALRKLLAAPSQPVHANG